jgi:hypothetical protein
VLRSPPPLSTLPSPSSLFLPPSSLLRLSISGTSGVVEAGTKRETVLAGLERLIKEALKKVGTRVKEMAGML